MILLSEADDLHEIIRNVAREEGRDMTEMHAIADEILGMPVGESTPLPGTLRVEPEPLIVFPPPLHEGWSETAEGKFLVPIAVPSVPRQVRRLRRHLRSLTYFVAGLTMCFVSAIAVIAYRWNG